MAIIDTVVIFTTMMAGEIYVCFFMIQMDLFNKEFLTVANIEATSEVLLIMAATR